MSISTRRSDPLSITLTAEIEGSAVARQSLRWLVMSPDLIRTPIREDGLVATLFHPSVPSGVVTSGIGANPFCFFRSSWLGTVYAVA